MEILIRISTGFQSGGAHLKVGRSECRHGIAGRRCCGADVFGRNELLFPAAFWTFVLDWMMVTLGTGVGHGTVKDVIYLWKMSREFVNVRHILYIPYRRIGRKEWRHE